MRILFTFLFSGLLFSSILSAQLNVRVGYSASFNDPEFYNTILNDYNVARPWLDQNFDDLRYLQGLQLGFRYRFGPAAIDLAWHNRFKRTRAEGIDPVEETSFQRDINFRLSSYSVGVENFIGNFSYGATFDVNNLNIRTQKTGRDDRFTIEDQYGTSSQFFISYSLEGSTLLHFCIRPFIQIPWSGFDLKDFANELNPAVDYGNRSEKFMNFGIMFIFFNGE